MVKNLHEAGIEVILDVVYNHTCEGNHLGPMLCLKGVCNTTYYRLMADNMQYYMDYTADQDRKAAAAQAKSGKAVADAQARVAEAQSKAAQAKSAAEIAKADAAPKPKPIWPWLVGGGGALLAVGVTAVVLIKSRKTEAPK